MRIKTEDGIDVESAVVFYRAFREHVRGIQDLAKKEGTLGLNELFKIGITTNKDADIIVMGIAKSLRGIAGREEEFFDEDYKGGF